MKRISLISLFFLGSCVTGCKSFQETVDKLADTASDTVDRLEESGADYDATLYLTTDWRVNWNPFGFDSALAGSYFHANVAHGRGLADRPPNVLKTTGPAASQPSN